MRKSFVIILLEVLLLIMTITYILVTLPSQTYGELIYTSIYLGLVILYYILRLIPEDD